MKIHFKKRKRKETDQETSKMLFTVNQHLTNSLTKKAFQQFIVWRGKNELESESCHEWHGYICFC